VNHIATGRALSPRENYSLLIMGDSNVDGDGGEVDGDSGGVDRVDGDGSRGTSRPNKVPEQRLLSPSTVVALRNFTGRNAH
jgi:hypothetical protein